MKRVPSFNVLYLSIINIYFPGIPAKNDIKSRKYIRTITYSVLKLPFDNYNTCYINVTLVFAVNTINVGTNRSVMKTSALFKCLPPYLS